jgi:acyl-CoA thioester hydrolase
MNPKTGTDHVFETARGTVHSWQCDHMGHANLRAYGDFFEQALWHVFHRLGITPSVLRGDLVVVKSKLVEMRERSLKMLHEMQHVESGEVCATCELTAVCIDARTRKPRTFPPEVNERAKEIL